MAVQVLAAADRRSNAAMAPEPDDAVRLTQYARGSAGFEPRTTSVAVAERPPAASVEAR